ncbi:MAG: M56 family metallopeptidase [Cryobacterium sp.]
MLLAAIVLGLLAVALAAPVPIVLARAHWPSRAPATALLLWESVALAGGVSIIGSLLCFGLLPFGDTLPQAIAGLGGYLNGAAVPSQATFGHWLALCGAVILAGHLLLNLAATSFITERQRRRHHNLIALLSDPLPDRPGFRVIDYPAPVAYCLPGVTQSATVLSAGLLTILDTEQLRGVIAHEQAHLQQKHHLVLLAFKSWRSALPWFPIANRAQIAVALLVELLADDRARQVVDDRTLATAIVLVGSANPNGVSPVAAGDPGALSGDPVNLVAPRVQRLVDPPAALTATARWGISTAAAALLATPPVLLLLA